MLLLLLACRPVIPDCEANQHVNSDYECIDDPEIPGADLLPACEVRDADSRIDVTLGCADGACSDDTYDAFNSAIGETGSCSTTSGFAFCDWEEDTLGSFFDDVDGDDVPDVDAPAQGVYLDPGFDGATEDGLGLDVSLACWIVVYGYTDLATYTTVDEVQYISQLQWGDLGLIIHSDPDGEAAPSGFTTDVALFGKH